MRNGPLARLKRVGIYSGTKLRKPEIAIIQGFVDANHDAYVQAIGLCKYALSNFGDPSDTDPKDKIVRGSYQLRIDDAERARGVLIDRLKNKARGVPESLENYYREYQAMRDSIVAAFAIGAVSVDWVGYAHWQPADQVFLNGLRSLIAAPELDAVRGRIKSVGWGVTLPQKPTSTRDTMQAHGVPTNSQDVRNSREKADALPIRFSAPDGADLEISLVREEFHPFEYKAILLEAKIEILNRTTKTKYVGPFAIESPTGGGLNIHDIDVSRAIYRLKEKKPPELHGVIGPEDTLSGWLHASLPHQPWGGIGEYSIKMEDEMGTQYTLRRERRGSRERPSSQSAPDNPTPQTGNDG